MSPDLEPQGTENVQPTPPLATPDAPPPPWIPTRRWLLDGVSPPWSIEERHAADGPSLFFMNDGCFVRVRDFPSNWRELPEETLADLLEHPRGRGNRA